MAGGREIKSKIKSVQNTRKVTRALEMVSASKIRKAQDRMKASRPYARAMKQLIGHVAQANGTDYVHPWMVERADVRRVGYIVVSSDRPPKQLATLEDRLRTRFEWGLITDVQPPELEIRMAILLKKAQMERIHVPPDVLELIATRIDRNIRELEGALIRVTAFASLTQTDVTYELAEMVLRDLVPDTTTIEISSSTILSVVAEYFEISVADLKGTERARAVTHARQIAMYLCRELTDESLPTIGKGFGGRDHTTVMHANKKIRQLMAERRATYNQVTELTNRIKQQASG